MTDYANPHAATSPYEPPEEIFDDYGRPATEQERPFYRPGKKEDRKQEDQNPIRKDQGDDISSIIGRMGGAMF